MDVKRLKLGGESQGETKIQADSPIPIEDVEGGSSNSSGNSLPAAANGDESDTGVKVGKPKNRRATPATATNNNNKEQVQTAFRGRRRRRGGRVGIRQHQQQPASQTGVANSNDHAATDDVAGLKDPKEPPFDVAGLESASFHSRLCYTRMMPRESTAFPGVSNDPALLKSYLYIRSKMLLLWLENPRQQLLIDHVLPVLELPFRNDTRVIERTYAFLERQCLINYGVFHITKPRPPIANPKTVVVIGAGIAGLAAARQLNYFGFKVIVVEARNRVGGRISTFRSKVANDDAGEPLLADLGAMVVMGLGGNPISVLSKQIEMDLSKVKNKCPLFEHTGAVVPRHRDELIEREFNKILEATNFLSHSCNFSHFDDQPLSLGEMFELIIKLQEKHIVDAQKVYQLQLTRNYEELESTQSRMLQTRDRIVKLAAELQELKRVTITSAQSDFHLREKRVSLKMARTSYDELESQCAMIERRINDLEEKPLPATYLPPRERLLFNWHMANLEFANAVPLDRLSLAHWSQDDDYELKGSHHVVRNGYSCMPEDMARGLDVRLGKPVQRIEYDRTGVRVVCEDDEVISGDLAILTLPLGVLKDSIAQQFVKSDDEKATTESDYKGPTFSPPLPHWKVEAIRRLGFGNLNKVVLCFDRIFWDASLNLFGHVSNSMRGEYFLFWSTYKGPILLALVSGEAANKIETESDSDVVSRCLAALRAIYSTVPDPIDFQVTRWKSDRYARGSYSHISVGASGRDYDIMSAPVAPPDELEGPRSTGRPNFRLFFAGEHTVRQYPASVHGALLSGFREVSYILEQECPF